MRCSVRALSPVSTWTCWTIPVSTCAPSLAGPQQHKVPAVPFRLSAQQVERPLAPDGIARLATWLATGSWTGMLIWRGIVVPGPLGRGVGPFICVRPAGEMPIVRGRVVSSVSSDVAVSAGPPRTARRIPAAVAVRASVLTRSACLLVGCETADPPLPRLLSSPVSRRVPGRRC